jgi:probable lipoprotein NlpC
MIKRYAHLLLVFAVIVLASCHSKRAVIKGGPGEVIAPQPSITEKYALLLGVSRDQIQNGRLYAFIDQWMGTPYKFGGQDHEGIDCSGFSQLLEQTVYGISIPRTTSQQVQVIKRKFEEELQEGDLVFFDYDGRKFGHVGVYLQNGYYVHAGSKGVAIVKLRDPYLYKYFSRCGSVIAAQDSVAGK